ncbi:MAG: PSD1 and planctomycete cytochrome C domain-containing protein [Isosphaeraceae bacterium]
MARADADSEGIEFFEKQVRPILAARCQTCHGPDKRKGELRLDSRTSVLAGGRTGPAVVPGQPDDSLLIDAVNYGEIVQMPPKSKLKAQEIAVLTRWVAMGAPWPGGEVAGKSTKANAFDLEQRAEHWSFQPVRSVEPPQVADASWPRTSIDRFVLARLEAKGLKPAPDADRRTLIRRVNFDLIGLPPTPEEIDTFLNDQSPGAYEALIERLLASPHYGERWGRHWLDLMRFAETAGHEFDYDVINAFRYRDYVIRAFNADVPYDQFVVEQIAGDLLDNPRRHPTERFNESVLGTGFYFLGEGTHSPVDVREDEVAHIENQIDVLSKTFLGLTVACARCHDHKFDPITTKDYYALAGYMRSSRHQQAFIDPPERIGGKVAALIALKGEITTALTGARSPTRIGAVLKAAQGVVSGTESNDVASLASSVGLGETRFERWVEALRDPAARQAGHPLFAWTTMAERPDEPFATRRQQVVSRLHVQPVAEGGVLFEDFNANSYVDWSNSGDAFGPSPTLAGAWRLGKDGPVPVIPGTAHSGLNSERLQGVLRSKTFTIEKRYLHYLAAGRHGRINLIIDGFEKVRAPIYGGLTIRVDDDQPRWVTQDLGMWIGHDVYIELADGATVNYTGSPSKLFDGDGFLAVDEIRASEGSKAPTRPDHFAVELLDDPEVRSLDDLAARFEALINATFDRWRTGRLEPGEAETARIATLAWLLDHGLIRLDGLPVDQIEQIRTVESEIPEPTLALAVIDGTGQDEPVHLRGNYKTPGDVVPRRFLEAIAGPDQSAPERGSGRLELAKRIVDPSNPLTARVIVNRIWQHHFGAGIVRSSDDFGVMGQPPTDPNLLDYLATSLIQNGWSIKQAHRLILRSHAYQMNSMLDPDAEQADPDNRLLHRMNVRRLESEVIRDTMLTVSGRLDLTLFGPSVLPYLTPFMDGRGRPAASGPLDGEARRSLYISVRRNFLTPMFLVFDFPSPASTMGRRNVSNVPAQALTLLNDPFVLDQARRWAERLLADRGASTEARLTAAYLSAFSRPPTESERAAALGFLGDRADDSEAWADLCHVLMNVKEFIFVN